MSKREKILVAASVLALIVGLVLLMEPSTKDDADASPKEDVTALIATLGAAADKDPSQGLDAAVMARVRPPWGPDPFYRGAPVMFDPSEDLRYQGYVRSGSRIVALINNREYRPGDTVEGQNLTVETIAPDRVILLEQGRRIRLLAREGDL
ncbi:hypothetical protein JCM14469_06670 [Desulfatiferula olefinivorans]